MGTMIKFKPKSIILTISGNPYGYGHMKRMKILKLKLKKKKISNRLINITNIKHKTLNKINFSVYDILFLDFNNKFFLKKKIYNFLIEKLLDFKGKIFIFDNTDKKIIQLLSRDKKNRFLIFPYYLTKKIRKKLKKIKCFIGPQYFLYDHIYINKNKNPVLQIKKIFLSCGGLDKSNFTYKISKFIFMNNPNIEIHAIIGPLFLKKNMDLIESLKKKYMLNLYYSVSNPSKISQYCDLAIVSSGLTKYEIAASGINLSVFSENATHFKLNQPFAASNVSYNLSNFSKFKIMKHQLNYLLKNYSNIFKKIKKSKINLLKNNKFKLILDHAK